MTDTQASSGTYAKPNSVGWLGWIEGTEWIVFVACDGTTLKVYK